jgi:hypothetical protein
MKTIDESFLDKAIKGLKNAATELEEFQLQLELGKAEASDKYEELKKQFDRFIHELKQKLEEDKLFPDELRTKLDELRLQLALGKAETLDEFKAQKKKLFAMLADIQCSVKAKQIGAELHLKLDQEIEKFQIKMEMLRLKFALGKMAAKTMLEEKKAEFTQKVQELKKKFMEKESKLEKTWEHFSSELGEAYAHLKKAFT